MNKIYNTSLLLLLAAPVLVGVPPMKPTPLERSSASSSSSSPGAELPDAEGAEAPPFDVHTAIQGLLAPPEQNPGANPASGAWAEVPFLGFPPVLDHVIRQYGPVVKPVDLVGINRDLNQIHGHEHHQILPDGRVIDFSQWQNLHSLGAMRLDLIHQPAGCVKFLL